MEGYTVVEWRDTSERYSSLPSLVTCLANASASGMLFSQSFLEFRNFDDGKSVNGQ